MAIEDTITVWWNSFLSTLAETLAFDAERIVALGFLLFIGLVVAKWGRGIIAKPLKFMLKWQKIQKITKIKPEDIDEKVGWRGLLYHVPNLFRIFILIFIVSIALDLLEFEEASGILGEVFFYFPNIIAVVILLWFGVWIHYVGTDIIKDSAKVTFLKGDRKIPLYGFYAVLWGIIIAISLTQLGIGENIIPILVGGMASVVVVVIISVRQVFSNLLMIDSLKSAGIENGTIISIPSLLRGKVMEIVDMGITHVVLKDEDGNVHYIDNQFWALKFSVPKVNK